MDKLMMKSQILKLVLVATFLIITPLLSSTSLRSTYLYLVVNILIIVVGAEAGLVSFFLKSRPADHHQNKRRSASALLKVVKPVPAANVNIISNSEFCPDQYDKGKTAPAPDDDDKAVEKYSSEKNNINNVNVGQVLKKSPSTPSIFFIDHQSGADEDEVIVVEDNIINDEVINGQDQLFHKAETFIGNFYKQLKMQREESWKKLQDLYHKAF